MDDAIKRLRELGLYAHTGQDWELIIHWSATEPTCPTITFGPEDEVRYRRDPDGDKIEEGLNSLVDAVKDDLCAGKLAPSSDE